MRADDNDLVEHARQGDVEAYGELVRRYQNQALAAAILGVARGTVKSRLSRALARLGPILNDLGPLVVVPPVIDLPHVVGQQIGSSGSAGAKSLAASALSKFKSRARHAATAR
jgi:hypothetical protein